MTSPSNGAAPPLPQSRRPAGPLMFQPPTPEEDLLESPLSPLEMGLESPDDQLDSSPSNSEPSSDELDEDGGSDRPSSRASSGGSALGRKALRAATIKGVLIGSEMVHRAAARTEGQRAVGLFRADAEDAENIGEPLADLIHRRGGIAGAAAAANPDVGDAIRMMMGLANFASKQVAATIQAREFDAQFVPPPAGDLQ